MAARMPLREPDVDTRLLGEAAYEAQSAHALRRPFFFAGNDASSVLLVHGFTGTPFEMRPLGEHLARIGHTVYSPLLAGHGLTSEALLATRAEHWARSIDEALDVLLERTPRVYVCGLSLGGLLSLDLARRRPDSVSAVTSIAAPLWLTRASEIAINVTNWLGGPPNFVLPKIAGADIAEPNMRKLNDRAQGSVGLPLPSVVSLHKLAKLVHKSLGQVRAPVFAIHARQDHVAPYACLAALVRGLAREESPGNVETLTLERSYHVCTLDYDREEIFAAIASHVARHAGRA